MANEHFVLLPEKTLQTEGVKFDNNKLGTHLLPYDAIEQITEVLDFGAKKYAERNWELGMAWHRPFGALMRHMWAWWRGQDKDPETGLSHLAHAGCCILFLLAYEGRKVGTDDRPHKLMGTKSRVGELTWREGCSMCPPRLPEPLLFD